MEYHCKFKSMGGFNLCKIYDNTYLDMVRRRRQKLKERLAAEPLVMAMPTPMTWRRSRCSDMKE